jgi:hypothetical protein
LGTWKISGMWTELFEYKQCCVQVPESVAFVPPMPPWWPSQTKSHRVVPSDMVCLWCAWGQWFLEAKLRRFWPQGIWDWPYREDELAGIVECFPKLQTKDSVSCCVGRGGLLGPREGAPMWPFLASIVHLSWFQ